MSQEIVRLENDLIDDRMLGQVYLPWLPEQKNINPLPLNFDLREQGELQYFLDQLVLFRETGNPVFIPPPYYDDQIVFLADVLHAKASIFYRAYYYIFSNKLRTSAPTNCFILPDETTVEHLSRILIVFGPRLKIVPCAVVEKL